MSSCRYSPEGIRTIVDNRSVLPLDPLERNLGLEILTPKQGDGFLLTARGDKFFPLGKSWTDTLPITKTELFSHISECNKVWTEKIVYHQPYPSVEHKPFLKGWDHPVDEATLEALGALLAKAGDRLFFHLFRKHKRHSSKMQRIVEHLEEASRAQELILTVTSGEFFVPWNMIYIHPIASEELAQDGSNFRWDGFWGYRHCIEHNPDDIELGSCVHPNREGRIPTSVNIDEGLDSRLRIDCIAPQLTYFEKHQRLAVTVRRDKAAFEADFRQPPFPYRIVYFCCHGATSRERRTLNLEQPWIQLTDRENIGANDLSYWLGDRDLESRPLIFINACQSGQMHSMYYESIASQFLEKKAIGLLGAQIDMPAIFAQKYAQMFFARLLGDEPTDGSRVGELVPALTRTLIQDHLNPLGLGYSLYRGMDCSINWTPKE